MKILMTTDTVGGVWTYALELARELALRGVTVVLATMGALPTSEQLDELRSAADVTLYTSEYRLEWMSDPWEDVERAGEWLQRIEQKEAPDLVHLNGYSHGSLQWHSPRLIVGHSCVASWWEAVKGQPPPMSWSRYLREVKCGLRSADMVVAPTAAMLSLLQRLYGPFDRGRVIHNARHPGAFMPGPKEPFVFAAGRAWDEAKNIQALESIALDLKWPVYVAGDEEHPTRGTTRLRNVRRLGKLPSQVLPHWYARASIYALPAKYEPFGLSALEAGLAGCALVLGDIPTLREIWGDAAVFVPPDDHRSLKEALSGLISSATLLADMAARASTKANEYTPHRMCDQYMAAVSELLGRTPNIAGDAERTQSC